MANLTLLLLILFTVFSTGSSWSQDELDIFDLVEEIGENFYDLLQVKRDCSSADIRKAYRKLSLQYHPDKNPDPNAAEVFTKIGAVAEVLKDEEKRAMYDAVLEHGLPDWKQPVYYYRRVRKMGMLEFVALIVTVLTVGQFLYGWAAYLEKQIVLYELRTKRDEKVRRSKGKKTHQQLETEVYYYELLAQSYRPLFKNLLPFAVLRKLYHLGIFVAVSLQTLLMSYKRKGNEKDKQEQMERERKEREKREREEEEEKERLKQEEEEKARVKSEKKLRKLEQMLKATRLKNEQREIEERKAVEENRTEVEARLKEIEQECEEDYSIGVDGKGGGRKKSRKGRKIIDLNEVMVDPVEVSQADQNGANNIGTDESQLLDVDGDSSLGDDDSSGWSQYQQKQLEWALSHYKKDIEDRWGKVAMAVPGKSKVDCLERYKHLVQLVQSKKKV